MRLVLRCTLCLTLGYMERFGLMNNLVKRVITSNSTNFPVVVKIALQVRFLNFSTVKLDIYKLLEVTSTMVPVLFEGQTKRRMQGVGNRRNRGACRSAHRIYVHVTLPSLHRHGSPLWGYSGCVYRAASKIKDDVIPAKIGQYRGDITHHNNTLQK